MLDSLPLAEELMRQRRKWAVYGPVLNIYDQMVCMAKRDDGSQSYCGSREDCELYVERNALVDALAKTGIALAGQQEGEP